MISSPLCLKQGSTEEGNGRQSSHSTPAARQTRATEAARKRDSDPLPSRNTSAAKRPRLPTNR